jgi:ATP-dependent Clp protease ATP-binding subunit ClpC
VLLQVLDAGELTDGTGQRVDFRNTILILTSNLGTREAAKSLDFGFGGGGPQVQSQSKIAGRMMDEVKQIFRPEFLNRLDEIVVFNMLGQDAIEKILDQYVEEINKRLTERHLTVTLTPKAREHLVEKGFKPEIGARLLRRTVEKYVEDPLAEELLKGRFNEGSSISVTLKNNEIAFREHKEKVPEGADDNGD